MNTTTTTMYKSQALAGAACGQHLELFIFDPMPKTEEEQERFLRLTRLYAELVSPYFVTNKNTNIEDWKRHYELYEEYCRRVDIKGEEAVLEELEDYIQSFCEEESDYYCMRWGMKVYKYDKKHFQKGEYGLFEGKEFPIGYNPEGILRVAYGDNWMYVPEAEGQIVHNAIKYDDMSFHEITKRYMKKVNRESVFAKLRKNKRSLAHVYENKIKISMLVQKEKIVVGTKHINNQIAGREDELRALLEDKRYDELKDEFAYYHNLQMARDCRRFDLVVPISDKNLATWMLCLIEIGLYFTASGLLSMRKLNDEPLSEELVMIEEEIDYLRRLSVARYDEKDEALTQELIDEGESKYPGLLDIYRSKLWIMDNNAETDDDFRAIDELCDEALAAYSFDGEMMAIHARAKSKLGDETQAEDLYNKAIRNTRNGLIWQKVEDETGISRIEIERELIEEEE